MCILNYKAPLKYIFRVIFDLHEKGCKKYSKLNVTYKYCIYWLLNCPARPLGIDRNRNFYRNLNWNWNLDLNFNRSRNQNLEKILFYGVFCVNILNFFLLSQLIHEDSEQDFSYGKSKLNCHWGIVLQPILLRPKSARSILHKPKYV